MRRRTGNSLFGLTDEAIERIRQGAVTLAKALSQRSPQAFVFTGTDRGVGCTTAAIETARALRDALDLNPLLVMLSPVGGSMARCVTLNPDRALQDLRDSTRTLASCTQPGPYDLPVLASRSPGNCSDGAGSVQQTLTRALNLCDGTYDVVLVDTSPFLLSAETVSVCQIVPNVVLVLRAGHTRYEVLERVTADLQEQGATLAGTILNRHRKIIPNWFYRAFLR